MITKSNSKLFITIVGLLGLFFINASTASGMVSIPNLHGLTEQQARKVLADAGVKGQVHVNPASESDCDRDDVLPGRVCGQSPAPAGKQPAELEVWVFQKMAEKIRMTSVINFPVKRAKKKYRRFGGKGVVNTKVASESECYELSGRRNIEKGIVCGQDPQPGAEVPPEMPFTLYLQGDRNVDDEYGYPPDVSGMRPDEVISVLREFRFRWVAVKFSDDIKCQPGIVCSEWDGSLKSRRSDPPYGVLRIEVGSKYRRDKPAKGLRMPNLLGLNQSQACDRLDAIGVRGAITIYNSDTNYYPCDSDDVIRDHDQACSQKPAPGSKIGPRTRVDLWLEGRNKPDSEMAGQKSWIPMPETAGMSVLEASAMLKEKGFKKVIVERVDRPGCEPNIVCASSVKAAKRGYFDTPKTLFVGTDPTVNPFQDKERPTEATEETQETPLKGVPETVESGEVKH